MVFGPDYLAPGAMGGGLCGAPNAAGRFSHFTSAEARRSGASRGRRCGGRRAACSIQGPRRLPRTVLEASRREDRRRLARLPRLLPGSRGPPSFGRLDARDGGTFRRTLRLGNSVRQPPSSRSRPGMTSARARASSRLAATVIATSRRSRTSAVAGGRAPFPYRTDGSPPAPPDLRPAQAVRRPEGGRRGGAAPRRRRRRRRREAARRDRSPRVVGPLAGGRLGPQTVRATRA